MRTFEEKKELAQILAKSSFLPEHYKLNAANCLIALDFAENLDVSYFQVMQSTFFTRGKLTFSSSFAISLLNKSGLIDGGIRYKVEGESNDDLKVTAYAKLKNSGDVIDYTVTMKMAKNEGWATKNPLNKYNTLGAHMLRYRAAIFLIRTHIPEVLNGCYTTEEMEDVETAQKSIKDISQEILQNVKTSERPLDSDLTAGQKLQNFIKEKNISDETVKKWLTQKNVASIFELDSEAAEKIIDYYSKKEKKEIQDIKSA